MLICSRRALGGQSILLTEIVSAVWASSVECRPTHLIAGHQDLNGSDGFVPVGQFENGLCWQMGSNISLVNGPQAEQSILESSKPL